MAQVTRNVSKTKFESGDTPSSADFTDLHDSVTWNDDIITADRIVDGTTNKTFSATDKTKLNGVSAGATANDTDANLKNRANHTGTQTSATISDFTEAVQDAVAALLAQGSNVTLSYNDAANTLTVSAAGTSGLDVEAVRDAIGIALIGTGNISVTVNDSADTITVSTTATQNSTDAALRDRSTHTGTQSADTLTDGNTNKAFLATERVKLSGIATAATANDTDANLKNRANHTGTQTASTISDLTEFIQDTVAALLGAGSNVILNYDDAANSLSISATGSGGTGLDAEQVRDAIGVALVGVGNIVVTVNDTADTISITTTATANSTDAALRDRSTHTGTQAATTITEDSTHRFVTDTEKTTWNAKQAAGDYATNSALSSHTANTSNPHGVTKAQVGLANVDNTADSTKPVSTLQAAADTAATNAAISAIRNGVVTAGNDLAKLYALYTALNTIVTGAGPDGDAFVNTIQEMLVAFSSYPEGTDLVSALNAKVNTVAGKGLSANDYTNADKAKVALIPDETQPFDFPAEITDWAVAQGAVAGKIYGFKLVGGVLTLVESTGGGEPSEVVLFTTDTMSGFSGLAGGAFSLVSGENIPIAGTPPVYLYTASGGTFSGIMRKDNTYTAGDTNKLEVYLKYTNWQYVGVSISGAGNVSGYIYPYINLADNTVHNLDLDNVTLVATPLTGGWVKLEVTVVGVTATPYLDIALTNSAGETNNAPGSSATVKIGRVTFYKV